MLGMIASLNERADRMSRPAALTRATTAATAALVTPSGSAKKRSRQSKFNPTLPDRRFEGDPKNHVPITKGVNRLSCEMCKYLHDLARLEGTVKTQTNVPLVLWCPIYVMNALIHIMEGS